jgi:cytochrome b561
MATSLLSPREHAVNDSRQKLSTVTVSLHWLVAITAVGMLVLGFYMATTRTRSLWDVHKSIGVLIFLVILVRVAWRIRNGWPQPVGVYQRIERNLARFVQWTLIICTVIMPISGMVSSVAGGNDLTVFGLQFIADNPDPSGKLRVLPYSKFMHEFVQDIHSLVAWVLALAITLHAAGALKHHFHDRDGTLQRMIGAKVS